MQSKKQNILNRETLIPLGTLITLSGAFFGGVAWLTTINLKVAQLQTDVFELQGISADLNERIVRIEEKQDAQTAILEEVRLDVKELLGNLSR